MKYKCKISSTTGLRGTIVEITDSERARQLVARGVIAPVVEAPAIEAPVIKPVRKGGRKPKDADAQAEVKAEEE